MTMPAFSLAARTSVARHALTSQKKVCETPLNWKDLLQGTGRTGDARLGSQQALSHRGA